MRKCAPDGTSGAVYRSYRGAARRQAVQRFLDLLTAYALPFALGALGTVPPVLLMWLVSRVETGPISERVAAGFVPGILVIAWLRLGMPVVGFLCALTGDAEWSIWPTVVAGLAGILVVALPVPIALSPLDLSLIVWTTVPFLIGFAIAIRVARRGKSST